MDGASDSTWRHNLSKPLSVLTSCPLLCCALWSLDVGVLCTSSHWGWPPQCWISVGYRGLHVWQSRVCMTSVRTAFTCGRKDKCLDCGWALCLNTVSSHGFFQYLIFSIQLLFWVRVPVKFTIKCTALNILSKQWMIIFWSMVNIKPIVMVTWNGLCCIWTLLNWGLKNTSKNFKFFRKL